MQRAIPYILNLAFDDLDAVHEVKRKCEVEIRTYDKKEFPGITPPQIEQSIRVKYKALLIKELNKLMKRYKPRDSEEILKHALHDAKNKGNY